MRLLALLQPCNMLFSAQKRDYSYWRIGLLVSVDIASVVLLCLLWKFDDSLAPVVAAAEPEPFDPGDSLLVSAGAAAGSARGTSTSELYIPIPLTALLVLSVMIHTAALEIYFWVLPPSWRYPSRYETTISPILEIMPRSKPCLESLLLLFAHGETEGFDFADQAHRPSSTPLRADPTGNFIEFRPQGRGET